MLQHHVASHATDHTASHTAGRTTLEVTELGKEFGTRMLWRNMSFTLQSGQMAAITGPSGSGKSTLLNCIGLLEHPDQGNIRVDGEDLVRMGAHATRMFRQRRLGYLFQDYALIDNATIYDNLDIALPSVPRKDRKRMMDAALKCVGLPHRGRDLVFRLSGGEQQRVALARLIVKQPAIILADEPTGALDRDNADMVVDTLRSMAHDGGIVLIATHSARVAEACDQIVNLQEVSH